MKEVQALAKYVILVMFVLPDLHNKYSVQQVRLVFHNQVCVLHAHQAISVQYSRHHQPNAKQVHSVIKVKVNAHNVQLVFIALLCHHYRLFAKVAIILLMGQAYAIHVKLGIIVQ